MSVKSVADAVVVFTEALHRKGAHAIEFGYYPIEGDAEPQPGEPVKWWAKATFRGRVYTGEAVGVGAEPIVEAFKACAIAAGLTVRVRYE